MIIWLASYPKSGNTWLRAFITSLFLKKKSNNFLENMDQIRAYPLTKDFYNLLDDYNDMKKISESWIKSQNILNIDKKINFLKTHHVLCKINGNNFTNYKNSLAVIYIVRDPRNVITSVMHHYSINDYNEALKFIFDKDRFSGKLDKKNTFTRETEFPTYISNWKYHYNSWKSFKKNYLLVKYEDLVDKPDKTFERIAKFLSKILNININDKNIHEAINKSSFQNLQKSEEKFGFNEAPPDELTKERKKFFNLGPQNKWEKFLPNNVRMEIENNFKKEMEELNYL